MKVKSNEIDRMVLIPPYDPNFDSHPSCGYSQLVGEDVLYKGDGQAYSIFARSNSLSEMNE